jgi:hypothetical protein
MGARVAYGTVDTGERVVSVDEGYTTRERGKIPGHFLRLPRLGQDGRIDDLRVHTRHSLHLD